MSSNGFEVTSTAPSMAPASQDGTGLGRTCTSSSAFSIATTFYSAPDAVNEERYDGENGPVAFPPTLKNRHDSGFEEASHHTAASSPPRRNSSTNHKPLQAMPKSDSPRRVQTRSSRSNISTSPSSTRPSPHSRQPSQSTVPTASRSASSRNTTSRHSSTAHARRGSQSSSRRSSTTLTHPIASHNKLRPPIPNRSSSAAYIRPRTEDAFSIHHRSRCLFQSLEASLAGPSSGSEEARKTLLHNSSLPYLSRRSTTASDSDSITLYGEKATDPPNTYVPATVIDWTHPSTRQAEYEKIDRSCRGMRGLWRRIAPSWCRSNTRMGFYNIEDGDRDDDSDARSVRRYRLALPDDKGERGGDVEVEEKEMRPKLAKVGRTWSCFSSKTKELGT